MAEDNLTPNEQWRAIPGYEGLYEISDQGRLKRVASGRGAKPGCIIKLDTEKRGYQRAVLCRDRAHFRIGVHYLVLLSFVGPPLHGQEPNHRDSNPTNNKLANLEWLTHIENIAYGRKYGAWKLTDYTKGEASRRSKLKKHQVLEIRASYRKGNGVALAEMYGVTKSNIYAIVKKKSWPDSYFSSVEK